MVMKKLYSQFKILPLLLTLVIGCFDLPEDLVLPEWDVDLNVPLTNKTYTIYDMFKPQSKFSITSTLNDEDFYLVQTDNYEANSQVTENIKVLSEGFISQSFMLPANVPVQPVFIIFPDSVEVHRATFISGFLTFSIQNPSPAEITTLLRIPGVRKPDGSELLIECIIPAFEKDSIIYDLTNHEYILPPDQPSQNKNSLQIIPSATCQLNGTYEIINIYGYEFKFSSVTGILPRTSLGTKRTSSFLSLEDAADFRGKLFIREGELNFKSKYVSHHQNNFDLEIANIKLVGKRDNGEEKILIKNDGQSNSFQLINGQYNLTLDQTNSNLIDFLNFLPDSIIISSEYILNPSDNRAVGQVTNLDSIKFEVNFSTKSIFAIKQTNFIDTLEIDISQDDREKIRKGVGADLNIYLENAIPIDAFVKATVTDENYIPLFILTKNQYGIDSLKFMGSQVNSSTGQIISPTNTLNSIALNSDKIFQFSNARYMIISTTINTTNAGSENPNPPTVQFKSSDWLNIKCYGKVKYHVGSEGN